MTNCYYCNRIYKNCRDYVKICDCCQFRNLSKKILHFIWIFFMKKSDFERNTYIDKSRQKLFNNHQKQFFRLNKSSIFIYCKLRKNRFFLWKNVNRQHDCFEKLIINNEFKNRDKIVKIIKKYKNKRVIVLIYYFQVNDNIKKNINCWQMLFS